MTRVTSHPPASLFPRFCLKLGLGEIYNSSGVEFTYNLPGSTHTSRPTKRSMLKRISRQWLVISCLAVLTTACGGGGGSGGSNSSTPGGTSNSAPSSSPTPASSPTPTAKYSVRLSWAAPTTRADGTALPASALTGYRVFYTRDGSNQSEDTVVTVDGGNSTTLVLSLSIAGTYTFAITAIDSDGGESALSAPASITIN